MKKKTPSSLDYETLLHELALQSWHRALVAGDFARAFQNSGKLAQSRDRFWRWQGGLDLAITHLCRGQTRSALGALETAIGIYRDVPAMTAPAFEIEAHIFLEIGEPERTIELAGRAAFETPILRYLQDLALFRLSRSEALLRRAEAILPVSEPAGILVLFARASTFLERGEDGKALELFQRISSQRDALLYWPIPYVRSFACAAKIRTLGGDRLGARSDWETFLSYWMGGDIDRDLVEEAIHFVKA